MERMIRTFFISLVLITNLAVRAQQPGIQPDDPAFILKYENFDFHGKFAAMIGKDEANNYFLADFSKLPSRFDRVYFMNLSFSSPELVNIDPVITKDKVCFKASVKNNETEVIKLLEGIEQKVMATSSSWTEAAKSDWLKNNDKYK
jgi:hypothetical protein